MNTKFYKVIIKITTDDDDIDTIASNYEDWLNDAILDDNCWGGDGENTVELISWKEVEPTAKIMGKNLYSEEQVKGM